MPGTMATETRVTGWNDLIERLYANSWNPDLRRFRSNRAFRGLEDASHELETSLARLGGPFEELELDILRNFRKYAGPNSVAVDSTWYWLAVGKHHGLPTRLLDWTYSPFVALHFATADVDKFDQDGVIWCVDYVATKRFLPAPLRTVLKREDSNAFTVEMLAQAASDLPAFDKLSRDPFLLFFEPPSLDDRIVNQFALFSVMSSPAADMSDWAAQHADLCERIIVPASAKWEIRDKLDQANISERVLFPGLDGLSRWLTRYYSPNRAPRLRPAAKSNPQMRRR
jgi:hypothetical protein